METPAAQPGPAHSGANLIGPLIAGLVFAVPAGWLLAYLAALPVYLGLFFFLLVGLLLGATMYRFGKHAIPMPVKACWFAGTVVAVFVWLTVLVVEYRWFPPDAGERVAKAAVGITREQEKELQQETTESAIRQLRSQSPPGGFIGYIRWAATDGTMEFKQPGQVQAAKYTLAERRFKWVFRVVITLMLLSFSILSQVLGLAKVPAAPEAEDIAASTEPGPESPSGTSKV